MNKVFLIGNLTRNPELASTTNGSNVCKFSIAVNRNFTNANGERDCDFFNVVVWNNLGSNCYKYLEKGKKVGICGRLQSRTYQTERGENRSVTEIVADEVEFLSPREDAAPNQKNAEKPKLELTLVDDDDLPF